MDEMTMWGGRFTDGPSALLRALNDSFAFDRELFAEDVEGSIAWAGALLSCGVLSSEEHARLVDALRSLRGAGVPPASRGTSRAADESAGRDARRLAGETPARHEDAEDVHSFVEASLRELVGPLAGKLHTGRSRNDQVATDLKLWLKKACDDVSALTSSLVQALAQRALDEAATPMPGYTHLKQAEPITFGHWCMAYVAMLRRDLSRIADATSRGDECPLGSAALAGTPLAIDRDALARELGFARATSNSIDAVSDRDFAAEYLFCASLLLSHLSRLAEDLIFFTSDEAGYAELPDALATGSSRMPQKKNPDVLELTRGHAARAIGELTGFLALLKGLPLAYNKDLQLDKEPLFRTRATLAVLLPALTALVASLQLNRERMRDAAGSELLLATARADRLAATGIPFREAHEQIGRTLGDASSITVEEALNAKNVKGGTAPQRVQEAAREILE
jgi:argininosuccinate lyase